MPTINSINLNGISYALEGGGGNSQDIEDIKRLIYPSITTVCEEGKPITFTKGNRVITVTPTESGTYTQYIPELGTWTVEMESGGVEFSRDVEIENIFKNYSMLPCYTTKVQDINCSVSRTSQSAIISIGEYILVGGEGNLVDAYDLNFIKTAAPNFSEYRYRLAGGSIGNFALFAGGTSTSGGDMGSGSIDVYNKFLIKEEISYLSESKLSLGSASMNNFILFGGGYTYRNPIEYLKSVDAYNINLIKTTISPLTNSSNTIHATSTGSNAFFNMNGSIIDVYDNNLIKQTPLDCTISASSKGASANSNYALFGGGATSIQSTYSTTTTYYKNVDAYNNFYVKTIAPELSDEKSNIPGTFSLNNCAFFAYGSVDAYSSSLIKQRTQILKNLSTTLGAVNSDNKALLIYGSTANTLELDIEKEENNKINATNFISFGKELIPKSSGASNTDDIFIGSNSTSPTVSNAIVRKTGIIASGTVYIFIKKSLFNFSKNGDTETADNARKYLTIMANAQSSGNGKHFYYTVGSGTSTHFSLTLYNVASPFRIYLQN